MTAPDSAPRAHILIVDDDANNRDMLSMRLEMEGHTCVAVESGPLALEEVGRAEFGLVLLDIMMPGMSGVEVLGELRKTRSVADLPVIMATAKGESRDVVEALTLGANDYVVKPLDMAVVNARIDTQLSLRALREDLRRAKEFSESVIESPYEMIICVDLDRRITLFNTAAEARFGRRRVEVLGQHIDMLYADTEEGARVHNMTLRENGFTGEVRNRGATGEEFTSHLSASVQHDRAGEPVGLMGISVDLTEQKRLEAERTALLQKKEEFLSLASHDLKSPLGCILGYASLLADQVPPGAQMTGEFHQFAIQIRESSRYMARLVEDFLDFTAMEDGRVRIDPALTDLAALAQRVAERCRPSAERKEIALSVALAESLPPVRADAARLEQVLENYVSNAVKFCRAGDRIEVMAEAEESHVELRVADSGPGLPEEEIPRAFNRYTRLSNLPTGGEKSTGLGLSICKHLVELHGGQVGVRNTPGGGATFWFRVPMIET